MLNICNQHQANLAVKLRKNNLKATPARLEILDILEHNSAPLTIEEIGKRMKTKKADTTTIYRIIEFLKSVFLVKQVSLNTNQAHYELVERPHHHHLVCQKCGIVKDILGCKEPELTNKNLKSADFKKISYHSLEFFGVCNNCNNK